MSMIMFPGDAPCEVTCVISEASPDGHSIWGPVTNRFHRGFDQGWALEKLGHAVEYLVAAHLFDLDAQKVRDEQEAVQLLMRMRRAIFSECTKEGRVKLREDRVTGGILGRQNDAIGSAWEHYT